MKIRLRYIFVAALLFRLIISPLANHPDVGNHIDWGIRFFEYGANGFYAPESNVWSFTWPNQPPGTILIFALTRKVYELIFSLFWGLNNLLPAFPSRLIFLIQDHLYPILLKAPAIISDLGIAYLIYKFLEKYKYKNAARFGAILYLVNPVIWYNSSVWGQTDATINFFVLMGLWFLLDKKPVYSSLSIAISLYIKISLAIFLPIIAILFIKQKFSGKQIAISALFPVVLFTILTLPFSYPGEPFSWIINLYREKVLTNQLQVVTANAFNLWAGLTGIKEQSHIQLLGPLTYRAWGYILFAISYVPLLYRAWTKPNFSTIVWIFSLTAFSSFMLLTNMHERYLYPLFPYFTILASMNMKLLPVYFGVSGINLLNMYHLWWVPRIEFVNEIFAYRNQILPRILGFVNFAFYLKTVLIYTRSRGEV